LEKLTQLIEEIHWYDTIKIIAGDFSAGGKVVIPVIMKMSGYIYKKKNMVDWFSTPILEPS